MGVAGSRGGGAMSQVCRAEAQGATRLEQMGRPGVSQAVDTSPLGDAALSQGSAEGVLHAGAGHGRGSRGQTRSPAARSGEDPERSARGAPGAASKRKELLGQGAIAVLGPCALAAMAAPARRVNVAHRPMGAFLKPQTASRDGGEAAAVAGEPPAGEESTSRRGRRMTGRFVSRGALTPVSVVHCRRTVCGEKTVRPQRALGRALRAECVTFLRERKY